VCCCQVLADSFNKRFAPITLEAPRALLPLVNAPLIDYTIELLLSAGIETIYVFCVNHADKIQAYLSGSQWAPHVKTVVSTTAGTVGDALRRIHDENVIETDFVLCHADVVGNLPLNEILTRHRLRKEADPTVLMTTVYKLATPTHASRSLEDDTVVGLSNDNEILFWENSPSTPSVEIDPMLILDDAKGSMRLRYDLLDTHIDVCSAEVLQLFKDNFDYQGTRNDFMTGVLGDDITDHRLFADIVETEYAARVKDLRTYASVSHDVVHRWAAPILVDAALLDPKSSYRLTRGFVHREKNVRTHPRCKIGPDVVLGSGTSVGANSVVSKTTVGRNCTIGENCHISNCFLWAGVVVENNCTIEMSLLCNNVRIFLGSTVGRGCLLSFGVCVGPNVAVKSHSRLTREHVNHDSTQNADLGDKGRGFLWIAKEEEAANTLYVSGVHRKHSVLEDDSDDDNDSAFASSGVTASSSGGDAGDEHSGDDSGEAGAQSQTRDFDQEVREIVLEGVQGGAAVDNMALEINGRKFAHDKTFFECVRCVLWALLASVPESVAPGKPLLTALQKLLKKYQPLLQKFLQEGEHAELLWTLQEYCEKDHERFMPIFQFIVHTLYDMDLLDEEAIWSWEKEQQQLQGDDRRFLVQCSKFLEWLRTADDDSE
jgi:translation initiation factor eIF-2B subunit epsilon